MGSTATVRVGVATTFVALGAAAMLAVVLPLGPAEARTGYGRRTGQQCAACHVDPDGGGDLTEKGQAFAIAFAELADPEVAWAKIAAAELAGAAPSAAEAAAPAAEAAPPAEATAGSEGAALAGG